MEKSIKCNKTIKIVVGVDLNDGIGYGGHVLFDSPEDKKYYEDKTLDSIVIMGKGTFKSLGYKPMPNRLNIVVSTSITNKDYPLYSLDELLIVSSFSTVIETLNTMQCNRNIFIIGGESVYKWFLANDYISEIYLIEIDKKAEHADTFFPKELYINKFKLVHQKTYEWLVDNLKTKATEKVFEK